MPITFGDGAGLAGDACGVGVGAGDGAAAEGDWAAPAGVALAGAFVPSAFAISEFVSDSAIGNMSVNRKAFVVFFFMTLVTFPNCGNKTVPCKASFNAGTMMH